ncbi:MAG: cyclohydrolase, partial [Campylobacterota bacterium]|nr:cyclohydrolase [Campylobacterota bacterium]
MSEKQDIEFEDAVKSMMLHIGENPEREGLLKTPQRVKKAYEFIFGGYKEDPQEILKSAL